MFYVAVPTFSRYVPTLELFSSALEYDLDPRTLVVVQLGRDVGSEREVIFLQPKTTICLKNTIAWFHNLIYSGVYKPDVLGIIDLSDQHRANLHQMFVAFFTLTFLTTRIRNSSKQVCIHMCVCTHQRGFEASAQPYPFSEDTGCTTGALPDIGPAQKGVLRNSQQECR